MKIALALTLVLASAAAAALGLGQIEVKSRIGQPLLAQIPIISSDPAELEALRAGLASPETFARIGLQPPQGIVADLQFAPALDAAGRSIIRVTTVQPVNEPLLTFLVEVDWGQGRLVREYSALLDTPRTVSAPVLPPIDAPVISPPNVIQRPAPPPPPMVAAPAPRPLPVATRAVEPTRRNNAIPVAPPRPAPTAQVAAPAPTPASTPASTPAAEYGPVKAGESLSGIAGSLDIAGGLSLEQSMIALLRANPDAFIDGNINQLKQGAVLRVPPASETAALDNRQAMALVQAQVRQWRQARRAAPQPAAVTGTPPSRPAQPPAAGRPEVSARLAIVAPGASRATRAGSQSGINAGGEGQMLRQELQQTKESLAARDAELRELKGRVAELEKLQADQTQLLTLKDTELAAAQQRLAASNNTPAPIAAPVQAPAQAVTTAQPTVPADAAPRSSLPWVLGGFVGLALLMLLGVWLMRRRAPTKPAFRVPSASSSTSLADTFGPAPPRNLAPVPSDDAAAPATALDAVSAEADASALTAPPLEAWKFAAAKAGTVDAEKRPHTLWSGSTPAVPTGLDQAPAPAWHGAGGPSHGTASAVNATTSVVETSVGERLELAQAYLDLGDSDSARQLLDEVVVTGDSAARQQASRMLRELG